MKMSLEFVGWLGAAFLCLNNRYIFLNIRILLHISNDKNCHSYNGVVMGLMDGFLRRTLFPVRVVVEDGGGELLGNDERNVIKSLLNCE